MLLCKRLQWTKSFSLGPATLRCTESAERAGLFETRDPGIRAERVCHCTRTHRLIQKYTLNEVTELRLKWLKCRVWAQKNCQQSLKIASLRSVRCGETIQENDTSAYTDAAAHLSVRQLREQGLG